MFIGQFTVLFKAITVAGISTAFVLGSTVYTSIKQCPPSLGVQHSVLLVFMLYIIYFPKFYAYLLYSSLNRLITFIRKEGQYATSLTRRDVFSNLLASFYILITFLLYNLIFTKELPAYRYLSLAGLLNLKFVRLFVTCMSALLLRIVLSCINTFLMSLAFAAIAQPQLTCIVTNAFCIVFRGALLLILIIMRRVIKKRLFLTCA